jgi:tRNA (guanine6-N2)-methyltransferase
VTALGLTTDPGLEDLAADELGAVLGVAVAAELRPDGLAGHLRVEAPVSTDDLVAAALRMRSIHHVVRPILRFAVTDLDGIRATVAGVASTIPELAGDVTFRATCARTGTHPFTSEDVERTVGAGVREVLPRGVRMKGFDVELRCDVRGGVGLLGVQVTRTSLSRRSPGPYRPETSLRANVAWAMLQLARPEAPPRVLLDPFVGGGTILAEAAARWPDAVLLGSDREPRCVEGCRQNLGDRAELRQVDARRLASWSDRTWDTVVTNPPWGRRLGSEADLQALYRDFLAGAAERAAADARMVVLVQRRGDFNRALRAIGRWETRHVRIVEIGGIYAGIFVLALG